MGLGGTDRRHAAAAGGAGLALFGFASHTCLGTPFGTLDPLVHDLWYLNVNEGRPIWVQNILILILFAQTIVAFVIALLLWARASAQTRGFWMEFIVLVAGTLLLGMMVSRSLAFASLLAALPLAWLLGRALACLQSSRTVGTKLAVALAMLLIILPGAPVAIAQNLAPADEDDTEPAEISESSCELERSARRLGNLEPGTVFAPLDIGPAILLETRHDVIATSHHRANPAMRDVIRAFVSADPVSRRIMKAYGADYVVLCTDLNEPSVYARYGGRDSLAARFLRGDAPDWLERVKTGEPDTFQVWRVRIPAEAEGAPAMPDGNPSPRR